MTPFATILKRYRERAGLGRNELARAAKCDPSEITRLEGDERVPSRRLTLALCAALSLDAVEADRLCLAAGYAPAWMVALAGVARIEPLEVARVAS